jgi:MYXO-CTERM domain-containing protein
VYAPFSVDGAWGFDTNFGSQSVGLQDLQFYAKAVRPGDVTGTVPKPQTYALMLSGMAALWLVRRRRSR